MKILNSLPLKIHSEGEHLIGESEIGDECGFVGMRVARKTSKDATIWNKESSEIIFSIEASFDNGESWKAGGGASGKGGIHVDKNKIEVEYSQYVTFIPKASGRRLRGKIIIKNGATKTSVDIFSGEKI